VSDLDDYKAAVDAEWGVYVAAEAIDLGGARAFNEGDPVPVSHVERGVVTAEQVKKRPKAGAKAAAPTTEEK
jgi:hypothetical protein